MAGHGNNRRNIPSPPRGKKGEDRQMAVSRKGRRAAYPVYQADPAHMAGIHVSVYVHLYCPVDGYNPQPANQLRVVCNLAGPKY